MTKHTGIELPKDSEGTTIHPNRQPIKTPGGVSTAWSLDYDDGIWGVSAQVPDLYPPGTKSERLFIPSECTLIKAPYDKNYKPIKEDSHIGYKATCKECGTEQYVSEGAYATALEHEIAALTDQRDKALEGWRKERCYHLQDAGADCLRNQGKECRYSFTGGGYCQAVLDATRLGD